MTEELKRANLLLFKNKLESVGVDTSLLMDKYGKALENATFTVSGEHGHAYEGSLLEIVLKILTPHAVRINELLPEGVKVDKTTLVKLCLLHHISKAVRLIPNDNEWEIEKRKLIFKYDESQPSIRGGLHSLVMAQECGIHFSPEEAEVMTVNDRELSKDDMARWHSSVMATIVRQANELTYLQLNAQ